MQRNDCFGLNLILTREQRCGVLYAVKGQTVHEVVFSAVHCVVLGNTLKYAVIAVVQVNLESDFAVAAEPSEKHRLLS